MCTPTSLGDGLTADPDSLTDPGHPDFYKNTRHYRLNADVEDIYAQWDALVPPDQLELLTSVVRELLREPTPTTARELRPVVALSRHQLA